MDINAKIYVAGHRGLVGSAIIKNLNSKGYFNIVTKTHSELDLTDQLAVQEFFKNQRPEYVFLAAAKVGGIPIWKCLESRRFDRNHILKSVHNPLHFIIVIKNTVTNHTKGFSFL